MACSGDLGESFGDMGEYFGDLGELLIDLGDSLGLWYGLGDLNEDFEEWPLDELLSLLFFESKKKIVIIFKVFVRCYIKISSVCIKYTKV